MQVRRRPAESLRTTMGPVGHLRLRPQAKRKRTNKGKLKRDLKEKLRERSYFLLDIARIPFKNPFPQMIKIVYSPGRADHSNSSFSFRILLISVLVKLTDNVYERLTNFRLICGLAFNSSQINDKSVHFPHGSRSSHSEFNL